MAIEDLLNKLGKHTTLCNSFDLQWSQPGVGFGSFYFRAKDDGFVEISNECMSKNFIKRVLCQMVDDAVLDDDVPNKGTTPDINRSSFDRAKVGREPTEDEILKYMADNNENYYNAGERLREDQYGGLPPDGYTSWGDFWGRF